MSTTVAALVGISDKDELEGMLAAHLLAAHNAAMECYRGVMLGEQTYEGRRENLNQATKLSHTCSTRTRRAQPPSRQRPAVVQGLRMLPWHQAEHGCPAWRISPYFRQPAKRASGPLDNFLLSLLWQPGRSILERDRGRSGRSTVALCAMDETQATTLAPWDRRGPGGRGRAVIEADREAR